MMTIRKYTTEIIIVSSCCICVALGCFIGFLGAHYYITQQELKRINCYPEINISARELDTAKTMQFEYEGILYTIDTSLLVDM